MGSSLVAKADSLDSLVVLGILGNQVVGNQVAGSLVVQGNQVVGTQAVEAVGSARRLLAVVGRHELAVVVDHKRLDRGRGSDSRHSAPDNTGCNKCRNLHSPRRNRCPF